VQGTIEAGRRVLNSDDPKVRAFAANHLTGRFTDARICATTRRLQFPDEGWTFRRAG
jgi:hypothetical protein